MLRRGTKDEGRETKDEGRETGELPGRCFWFASGNYQHHKKMLPRELRLDFEIKSSMEELDQRFRDLISKFAAYLKLYHAGSLTRSISFSQLRRD